MQKLTLQNCNMCIMTGISPKQILPLIFTSLSMTRVLHNSKLGLPSRHAVGEAYKQIEKINKNKNKNKNGKTKILK